MLLIGICYGATASTMTIFVSTTYGLLDLEKNASTTSLLLAPGFFGSRWADGYAL
jgi:hypothetical protein